MSRCISYWKLGDFSNEKRHFSVPVDMLDLLRGSGYLGYVDSNQGYNLYKWVMCTQILGL